MAKLGMSKTTTAKDLEKDVVRLIKDTAPKEDAFRKIAAALMSSCVDYFEQAIRQYRDNFVTKATAIVQGEAEHEEMLFPEGTRFCRRTDNSAVFVIEHKPQLRTLTFDESDEVNPKGPGFKNAYRLSLPYLIFVPAFRYYPQEHGPKPFFSAMCVAYRNEPLTSLNDMLYHPHLPNLGRPQRTNPREKDIPDGDVETFTEMVMCQGQQGSRAGRSFELEPTDLNDMIAKLQAHFWNSRYTGELATTWQKMQLRDQHFKSLATWEKHSQEDPLFVLKTQWVPAIRLGGLIQKVLQYHDHHSVALTQATDRYVAEIHDATWNKVMGKVRNGQTELATAFAQRLDEVLKRFAASLARGMTVITNDTVRRTVQIAIAQALKEAVG